MDIRAKYLVDVQEKLLAGCEILDVVMQPNGFVFVPGLSTLGSGGFFACGEYVNGDRRLEIHFRQKLGIVTYHLGSLSIEHPAYMRALVGRNGGNKYPGFSDDRMDGFRHLQYDLEHFCGDFLHGNGDEFRLCVAKSEEQARLSPFSTLK